MATWYTADDEEEVERLLGAWPDAPDEDTEQLERLLNVSREQVIAFAPDPTEDEDYDLDPPDRLVEGQLRQAINNWNAGRASADGEVGAEGYSFTPRPLDSTIRNIIRPRNVKPSVY